MTATSAPARSAARALGIDGSPILILDPRLRTSRRRHRRRNSRRYSIRRRRARSPELLELRLATPAAIVVAAMAHARWRHPA